MFVKPIEVPFHVRQYKYLSQRLISSSPHRKETEAHLARYWAGYRGEESLKYPFHFVPDDDMIFHNLRLSDGPHFFQLDFLVLTRSFLLILDVKNIIGNIILNDHQMIRTINQQEDAFPDPLIQAVRHQCQIKEWLGAHGFPVLPVQTLVVFTAKSVLHFEDRKRSALCILPDSLPFRISSLSKKMARKIVTEEERLRIKEELMEEHQELKIDFLNGTGIKRNELINGVRCEKCGRYTAHRHYGTWSCMSCGHHSKDVGIKMLIEYRHLFGPSITNRTCREFFQLRSESVARKLLTSHHLPCIGNTRDKVYTITDSVLEELKKKSDAFS